jgi:AraC family transcriptional activator of pyochelin receptor
MHTDNPDSAAAHAEWVNVSLEMAALVGCGPSRAASLPPHPVALIFAFAGPDSPACLRIEPAPCLATLDATAAEVFHLVLLVQRSALIRIGGQGLLESNHRAFHLPNDLRAIAAALREPPASPEARTTYRLAKSIELLCETIRVFGERSLVALVHDGALSAADSRRIVAARQMIDERWNEKLTLDAIARACGLNRAKLTRGFRELYDCSIAEALADRRLSEARRLLLTTDLPVSLVGYETGYLNNASFSRAFGRHFGRSPSHVRAMGVAA